MNKKLICLFLSLVLLLGACLVGCSTKTDEEAAADISDKASASAATLSMYLMSEKPVDAETAAMIEEAVNKITEDKFKTRLKLYYYTEAEYYAKLDAAFAERKAAGNAVIKNTPAGGEEETYVDEYGLVQIKYPTIASYQVDMFYLGGEDKYDEYLKQGMLSKLDSELLGTGEAITKYVPSEFLGDTLAKKSVSGGVYAIPTSTAIGDYTYLLLNKEVLDVTAYESNDYSSYTSLTAQKCQEILACVNDEDYGLTDKYYPLYTNMSVEEQLATNRQYWGVGEDGQLSDEFSVLGGEFKDSQEYLTTGAYAKITNLFEDPAFEEDLITLMDYKVNGYYGTEEEQSTKDFAVGYVKGGAELAEKYAEDYVMIPVSAPRLTEDDLYSDMFAISTQTTSVSRSMEILTHLNTNEDFRNLIQYGIEGEHYDIVDSGIKNAAGETYKLVERRSDSVYMMDPQKTGNTSLVYPLNSDDVIANISEYIAQQNLAAKISLRLGFEHDYNGFKVNMESLKAVRALSAEILADYKACETMDEFDDFLESAKAKIAASDDVKLHIDAEHELDENGEEKACDGKCGSLNCVYQAWLKQYKVVS